MQGNADWTKKLFPKMGKEAYETIDAEQHEVGTTESKSPKDAGARPDAVVAGHGTSHTENATKMANAPVVSDAKLADVQYIKKAVLGAYETASEETPALGHGPVNMLGAQIRTQCRGVCGVDRPSVRSRDRYTNGNKWCKFCDRVWLSHDPARCPCCHQLLRVRRRPGMAEKSAMKWRRIKAARLRNGKAPKQSGAGAHIAVPS